MTEKLSRKYVRVTFELFALARKRSGQEALDLRAAAGHVVAASVASEGADTVAVRANLRQAFCLVAPHAFQFGGVA
jgi:hypothetical protein